MKLLLTTLNSKYVHSNLALRYMYTVAVGACDFIEIKEFTINNSEDYVFTEILAGEYDAVCFSCYIWNVEKTVYLAENIKKARPGTVVVFGGPETSYQAEEFMSRHRCVDFVVMGEGEYAFSCLARALCEGSGEFEKIRGLAYRKHGRILVNQRAELLVFDSVPFPYSVLPCDKDKIVYYESSRGCPFGCTYCISSLEKKVRALPTSRVLEDMEYFLANGVPQVKFVDRTFNWDRARCKEIIGYIMNRDSGTTKFHFEICGEFIDDGFIELISAARKGLFQFEAGIQSTNKKALAAVKRSAAVERLLDNVRRLAALENVDVHVDLIAGLPFEDYYSFRKSFNDAYGLSAGLLQLGFLKLLKGTEICERAGEYGYEFKDKAPYEIISNKYMSAEDVCRLKQIEELLNLYYNKGGFERALKYATEVFSRTPFDFYEEFSFFYSLKGFHHRAHKKEDMYRILLEYSVWKCRQLNMPAGEFQRRLEDDMGGFLNPEAVKKFKKKGWGLDETS
ncbi:MAG: B12-binding domain-containing radical SAM protein [Clostridiales bacterium]|nr:B12-binding domain-containing radical SAM protein [Clostridiales bacterium]